MTEALDIPMITRVRAKNFKGLADIDVKLGPLNVLVGANGAGKSSFVDILRFIRDALGRTLDAAVLDRHGMSAIRRWSPKGAPYDVHLALDVLGKEWNGRYAVVLGSERRGDYRIKQEQIFATVDQDSNINKEARFNRDIHIVIKNGELINGPDVSKELVKYFFTGNNNVLKLPLVKFISKEINFLSDFISDMGFYTIYPHGLREPQKPSNPHILEENGQNLASVLRQIRQDNPDNLNNIISALNRVVGGVHDYTVSQVGGYLVTRLHHELQDPIADRIGPAFELAQESDGTLRMLGILAALYQNSPRSLLTIEEPELAIHPGALGVLCDVIQEVSMRNQIIITTHNPDLLDRLSDAHFLVVEREGDMSRIGPISEGQQKAIRQKLFSPGELMRIQGLEIENQE